MGDCFKKNHTHTQLLHLGHLRYTTYIQADGEIMATKSVYVLIFKICEYVNLHSKKDFADVIKIKDFEVRRWACII